MKQIILALMLAFASTGVAAQDSVNQYQYTAICMEAGKAKIKEPALSAVCNCSTQYVSYVKSNGTNNFHPFVLETEEDAELAGFAIKSCIQAYSAYPYNFMELFGVTSASVR